MAVSSTSTGLPDNFIFPRSRFCPGTLNLRVNDNKNKIYKFTGASQITSPNMKILVKAESNKQICKSVTVDIFEARNKKITKMNNLLNDIKIQKLS